MHSEDANEIVSYFVTDEGNEIELRVYHYTNLLAKRYLFKVNGLKTLELNDAEFQLVRDLLDAYTIEENEKLGLKEPGMFRCLWNAIKRGKDDV